MPQYNEAQKLSQSAQAKLGLPEGFQLYSPFPFGGMNQQASRIAMADSEFYWRENFIRIGDGNLRTVWDVGHPLYTKTGSATIVSFFFYYIGPVAYVVVFFSDGTAKQVRQSDGAVTSISSVANTFFVPNGNLPAYVQWGSQYLLISNNNTSNDYWIWDGTNLFQTGTLAPNVTLTASGRNYSSPPTVTAYGGSGTGATFVATVTGGGVDSVQMISPGSGYSLGDVPLLQFSGGGSDTSAILTPVLSAGGVTSVNVTAPGSGYLAATVAFTGGGGSGATASAVLGTGSVTTLALTAGGTNYTTASVAFSGGGGSGATGIATVTGIVNSVAVGTPGTGYTSPPTVTFLGGGATTPATGHATLTGTAVATVVIDTPGAGYTSAPAVQFTGGGGSGAVATATITGAVTSVTLTAGGTGYTSSPTVAINGDGTGATATATATGQGRIDSITVTDPGTGYTSSPVVVISSGSGAGAAATAYIASGQITSVTINDPGTNYITPPLLTVVGGNGTGAILTAQLTPTSVAYINVQNGGSGFFHEPTINFQSNGTGSGAAGTAVLDHGVIVQITLDSAGSGYTTPPTIQIVANDADLNNTEGYTVGGAAAAAILVPTTIGNVIVTAPGQGYTQTPGIIIGSGGNNAAAATVSLMPFGVSGAAIESYQQRVWLDNPHQKNAVLFTLGTLLISAPESLTDFATSDGGLLFSSNSPFLRKSYVGIKTVGDFLYPIGDSSVDVISNVQTSGNPATTTFNINNADPQTGTDWRTTIQDFSRTAIFTNGLGVYGIYGGSVTKLSEKMDDVFENALFPPNSAALTPSGAVAEIHEKKAYLVLMTVTDPFTKTPRNVMLGWDEAEWFIISQSISPIFIGTQVVDSVPVAWATDGNALYPMLSSPSIGITKKISTKLYGANNFPAVKLSMSLHMMAEDLSAAKSGVNFSIGSLDTENAPYPLQAPTNFGAGANFTPIVAGNTGNYYGCFLGVTLASTSPDFTLKHFAIGYSLWFGGWGSPPSVVGS